MAEIGLVEAIAALRTELAEAVEQGRDQDIRFPVAHINLEFQVGVTRDVHGGGKLRFWVLELGADADYGTQTIHKVTIALGQPVNAEDQTLKIGRALQRGPSSRHASDRPSS